jgi:hypothetical protein
MKLQFIFFRGLALGLLGILLSNFEPSLAIANDGSGIQISAAADIVGSANSNNGTQGRDRLDIREGELMIFSPIDHLFDATFSMAAHNENGEKKFEVHEAFIASSRLIPNSHFRIGQFFLGVGRLNQVHRHEWPFISAPKSHIQFFDEEAAMDTGVEYGVLAPTDFYLDLTLGLTNGYTYGHSHSEGNRPQVSTHYARLTTFREELFGGDLQLGLNYLSRTSAEQTKTTLGGLDLVEKWKDNRRLTFLVQSEVWLRSVQAQRTSVEETLGGYVYGQYGWNEQWFTGLRADYYSVQTLKDLLGNKVQNADYAFVPAVTFKPSEFSTFRVAYNHKVSSQNNNTTSTEGLLEFQATFIVGSHPAHSF